MPFSVLFCMRATCTRSLKWTRAFTFCCTLCEICGIKNEMKKKKGADDRLILNESQYKVVELIATRVCTEIETFNSQDFTLLENEPLRWVMHGGPGTGKTHVIKIIKDELFQEILGWNIGVEFQVVALQAVMADLLGGDTIHHALNIPIHGKYSPQRRIKRGQ